MQRGDLLGESVLDLYVASVDHLDLVHQLEHGVSRGLVGGLRNTIGILEQHVLRVVRQIEQEPEGVSKGHESADLFYLAAQGADDLYAVSVARDVPFHDLL